MTRNSILVDSSFLYALLNEDENRHEDAIAISDLLVDIPRIPDVILVEVLYLSNRDGGPLANVNLLSGLAEFPSVLEPLTSVDLERVLEIMQKYTHFDFVDCAIMAMSERLNITTILTLDQRDFRMFRPKHCEYYDIFP